MSRRSSARLRSHGPLLRSETVCYLVIVLNHMVSASCLTLVLPVLVFLWATLSVPRPSKTFWMTAIVYTEVLTVPSPVPSPVCSLSPHLSAHLVPSPVPFPVPSPVKHHQD